MPYFQEFATGPTLGDFACGGNCSCGSRKCGAGLGFACGGRCAARLGMLGERYVDDDEEEDEAPPRRPQGPGRMRTGVAGFGLAPSPGPRCQRTWGRAANFTQLIALVRAAEAALASCGIRSVEDRIHALRGLFYGTTWSNDFRVEQSGVRNAGFQVYTASTPPPDVRPCLTCGLWQALQASSDVRDGNRAVDFGHLMIGLDARRSVVARSVDIPGQGGPGLAISTWLGDLGGGAGMLAMRRASAPRTSVLSVFTGTDFGGSINLEGDLAGYLVAASPGATSVTAPAFGAGQGLADALQNYLGGSSVTPAWNQRARQFAQMIGGVPGPGGVFTNRASLVARLAGMIEQFGCWYLANRLRQRLRLTLAALTAAASHLTGAANEVAQVFVKALEQSIATPSLPVAARGTAPPPTPAGSPTGVCRAAVTAGSGAQQAADQAQRLYRRGQSLWREYNPLR